MMDDAAVFSVLSKCFAPVEEGEWNDLVSPGEWSRFLDGARRLLEGNGPLGAEVLPAHLLRNRCPLQEFLSNGEVDALYHPPTFEEKQRFAAGHFAGGLPESAVPVESLYAAWQRPDEAPAPFGKAEGLYLGPSAGYMRALCSSLGLEVPAAFAACPDHLALELDLAAVLLRSGMADEARTFVSERFEWLTAYRMRLLSLGVDARFYIGLVDVLLGTSAAQRGLAA